MRTVLILNPASGISPLASGHKTPQESEEAIINALRAHGIEPEVWYTTPEDTGAGLAKKAAAEGVETVIAAGGDGTQHAVAEALIHTQSVLGIIPLGTMNNVAHSLEIPEDIEGACAIIADGATTRIDVGMINGHIFMEVAGIGLEAAIFPAAEEVKSARFGSTLHGILLGLKTLFTFKPTVYKISFDDHRNRIFHAVQISVCNSPYYGAKLRFAPNALMDDGFLDALIYKNFSKARYLMHAIAISQGRHKFEPKVTQRKLKRVQISAEEPVEIHADGVPRGYTPATIEVETGALRVHVPKKVAVGPNITKPENKRKRIYQRAQSDTINPTKEERGPVYVK
jgi:diacylglycerol kinase (ATP)